MKRVFSSLLLMILCAGLLTFTIRVRPVRAGTPLSVSITPLYAVLSGGQSQIFNATASGGTLPYTYQWYIDLEPISGAINPTFNYTAPPYVYHENLQDVDYVEVLVRDSAGASAYVVVWAWEPAFGSPVYFSVEPVPTAPLINFNASINGLEIGPAPSPVGENFTVEIHLRNANATNAPLGVAGVEVHFYFGNLLDYCKPIAFTDELGQQGGALVGPFIYGVQAGFYNDSWVLTGQRSSPLDPPYSNATQYIVAAARVGGINWNGNDGLVARITFQITAQPTQNMNQTDFSAPIQIGYADLADPNANSVPFSIVQGTLHIDAARALVGDLNGDGKVDLQDLVLLAQAYGSKPGDPNWNQLASIAPPYDKIGLTDLVTLATHYGQHYP